MASRKRRSAKEVVEAAKARVPAFADGTLAEALRAPTADRKWDEEPTEEDLFASYEATHDLAGRVAGALEDLAPALAEELAKEKKPRMARKRRAR